MAGRVRFDTLGGAAKCTLAASIDDSQTTITVSGDVSGWPTGAGGRHFCLLLERGTSRMEKLECSALTGSSPATITVTTRGYDGSVAQAHSAGVPVEEGFGGLYLAEHEAHVYDTTRDDHSQYLKTDGTRAFSGVSAIAGAPVSVGTANATGSATTLARSDHVHGLANGAINAAAMIAAGTIIGTNIVAGGVGTTQLADSAVTSAKIADGTIATADIADSAVTSAKIADGTIVLADHAASNRPVTITGNTAPSSPTAGDLWFDNTLGNLKEYQSATTGWTPPWNTPWGVVAELVRTTTNDLGTSLADVPGCTLTFTGVGNRYYVITLDIPWAQSVSLVGHGRIQIQTGASGSGTLVYDWIRSYAASDYGPVSIRTQRLNPAAGSISYHARAISDSGALRTNADQASAALVFRIEDVGPAGAPA